MASERFGGGFYPNGSSAVNNELNKESDYQYSVERISTGVFRLSLEPFFSTIGFVNSSLVLGTNPGAAPGYTMFCGTYDIVSEPRTFDILVYDTAGDPVDIPFDEDQFVGFYVEAIY